MNFLKHFIDFYIQSSLHVGIAVMCLVYVTQLSSGIETDSNYSTSVFFGTVLGYNFLKYIELYRRNGFQSTTFKSIVTVTFLVTIGFFVLFLHLERTIQIHLALSGVMVLVYPLVRKYGWLKLFFVSAVVTYITVYIPFLLDHSNTTEVLILSLQRFFIIISMLIPFEIMDSKKDAPSLRTLPQMIGIAKSKLLGILVLFPVVLIELLKQNRSYGVISIAVITALFIRFTFLTRTKYYTTFWVESIPIFWWVVTLLHTNR